MTQQDTSGNTLTISTFGDCGVPIVSQTEIDPMKTALSVMLRRHDDGPQPSLARTESRRAGRHVLARLSRTGHLPVGIISSGILLAKRATQLTRIASMDPRSAYRDLVTHRFK
jgi:hypothetical protein